ncbi:MAG TPA: zinc-dependent peptidase [Rhodocyclaceae bacterium]|nr:zinc-dependent peptidase [Rhodocyclaceae bacterium]
MGILDFFRRAPPATLPDSLWEATLGSLPFLAALTEEEKTRLRELVAAFLAEKEFSAAGGLELDDSLFLAIAAQACLPILELGLGAYRGWVGIVVYPDEFVIPRVIQDEDGVVHEYDEAASGEAWGGGPVIVSWKDAQMAGDGYNVVIHEFAHKLDMANGEADGVPPLPRDIPRRRWEEVLTAAYEDFCRRVDADEETWIDPYGAEHPSEFFAVVSEAFFEIPDVVADESPEFYHLLPRFYRQDPLTRLDRMIAAAGGEPS